MTQEEKAKRFDEVIDKAEALYKAAEPMSGCNVIIETLFPELKESEDEKIRKALIDYFKWNSDGQLLNEFSNREVFSWLEKQGEHDSIEEPNFFDNFRNSDVEVDSNEDGLIAETIRYKKEKQGEQKPADKVEPKFKVGDWVVSPNGVYWHIDKISNNRYEVTSSTGESSDWNLDTNIYHRFTIQDAKDGDVLVASDKSLFIYDGSINENFSVGFHIAFTGCMDIILNSDDGCGWEEKDSCHPATKEQRDTLMKEMADAGYTFDFEKKELKKIEHSPAWSEEDERERKHCIDFLNHPDMIEVTPTIKKGCIDWLKSLKDRYTWIPSDAQVASINCAVRKMKESACYDSELVHLLQDLKKLREE